MPAEDQKISRNKYQIIPRVLVFASRGEHLLLIKGAPDKRTFPNLYNGVGGHVEIGEDILSAARREFFEETGLQLINPFLCLIATIDINQNTGIGMFVIKATAGEGIPKESNEGKLKWVNPAQIDLYPLVEDLPIILPRIERFEIGDPVLFAQYRYSDKGKLVISFSE
jgi:8-oxo-dGTP diphosphatase